LRAWFNFSTAAISSFWASTISPPNWVNSSFKGNKKRRLSQNELGKVDVCGKYK